MALCKTFRYKPIFKLSNLEISSSPALFYSDASLSAILFCFNDVITLKPLNRNVSNSLGGNLLLYINLSQQKSKFNFFYTNHSFVTKVVGNRVVYLFSFFVTDCKHTFCFNIQLGL